MLLGLLRSDRAVAAIALAALGVTAEAARRQLEEIARPAEDGASSYGISRRITFTRMGMGLLSHTITALAKTGHAEQGQPRTPQGPYLCTGEMLVAMIGVLPERVVHAVPTDGAEAVQVLNRLGVDRSAALGPVIEQVRRSPADERWHSTLDDARRIVAVQQATGRQAFVDMFSRFSPANRHLRQAVADRRYGPLKVLEIEGRTALLWEGYDLGLQTLALDMMHADFDLVTGLLGGPARSRSPAPAAPVAAARPPRSSWATRTPSPGARAPR
jgi:hypothetical protein